MPRKSRIDASGALHHITALGIEQGIIFRDDADREDFIERLAGILVEAKPFVYRDSVALADAKR